FSRYPGNGKSTPSVLTLATSVPRPPSGPPPAFGGGVVGLAGATSGVGVAGGVFLRSGGAFVLAGIGIAFWICSARLGTGGAFSVGAVLGGVGVTTPAARGPGGAATMLTRYIGGSTRDAVGWTRTNAATTARCRATDMPNGPPSRALLGSLRTATLTS